jgi:HSP20 family protein
MALIRWEPARELGSLQNEMNRLFSSFFDVPGAAGDAGARQRWIPAMDLVETDEHFVLRADLPGLRQEDINLELEDRVLTISGERRAGHESREGDYHRIERAVGTFSRSLTLPEGIDADAVQADFDNGVLEVRIPKPEERKPRRLTIGIGDQPATIEGAGADK